MTLGDKFVGIMTPRDKIFRNKNHLELWHFRILSCPYSQPAVGFWSCPWNSETGWFLHNFQKLWDGWELQYSKSKTLPICHGSCSLWSNLWPEQNVTSSKLTALISLILNLKSWNMKESDLRQVHPQYIQCIYIYLQADKSSWKDYIIHCTFPIISNLQMGSNWAKPCQGICLCSALFCAYRWCLHQGNTPHFSPGSSWHLVMPLQVQHKHCSK